MYQYRGEIKGQRKYRFSILGISKEQLRNLDRLEQQWREMQELQRDVTGQNRE